MARKDLRRFLARCQAEIPQHQRQESQRKADDDEVQGFLFLKLQVHRCKEQCELLFLVRMEMVSRSRAEELHRMELLSDEGMGAVEARARQRR